nr:6-carboxytetrahydropterin synthase [uncultured Holophaga sp.]
MSLPTLTLQRPFVADHFHDLPGFMEPRHGHNWAVEAEVRLEGGGEEARFVAALDHWVSALDYSLLNEHGRLQGRNPTAELLAQWAFEHLEAAGCHPVRVRIREKANYWAACLERA